MLWFILDFLKGSRQRVYHIVMPEKISIKLKKYMWWICFYIKIADQSCTFAWSGPPDVFPGNFAKVSGQLLPKILLDSQYLCHYFMSKFSWISPLRLTSYELGVATYFEGASYKLFLLEIFANYELRVHFNF